MRKLTILMMAFLLPFSTLEMRADDEEQIKKIPLRMTTSKDLTRSTNDYCVEAFYCEIFSCIQTTMNEDIGQVELTVVNTFTSESWNQVFNSAIESQSFLPISGTKGYYVVEYVTESGNTYSGFFVVN